MSLQTLERPTGTAGLLRFIHYGFMPNHLGYCGGDDNRELFEYGAAGQADAGLMPILRQFTGALPYLKLIAGANDIVDPFDERVVEAYWLGNDLLERVEVRQLYDDLVERFRGKLSPQAMTWVAGKAPAGARPHHNFHVFDVHSRAGEQGHSLETMDNCRISWGKVLADVNGQLFVERQPLVLLDGKLALGAPVLFPASRQYQGRGFVHEGPVGAYVSLHWGWVCELLTPRQLSALQRNTMHHLRLANETL
ncbi:MAG: hypothetical protein JO247_08065 [Chloroflexi bacterium]|nr:hypothetical protein [Chloroflexota bacterium]